MTNQQLKMLVVAIAVTLSACKRDNEPEPQDPNELPVNSGMVIACEGSFMQNNASIHWIGDDGTASNNLFLQANGTSPGDVLQSYREFGGKGYVVVNNSQKVEVISASTFTVLNTITGCDYPRDVLVLDGSKGYISNGSVEGELLIFNPANASITGSISVGLGPEQVVSNGQYVFVANSGGWSTDNTVSVINPLSDQVVATVTVGDRPVALQVDAQNNVWVLCKGEVIYDANWNEIGHTDAELIRIDGSQHAVSAQFTIGVSGDHPEFMASNADRTKLHIVNGALVTADVNLGTIYAGPIENGNFRAVGVNSATGEIYLSSTTDFITNDQVFVYGPQGNLRRTLNVGIAVRSMTFRD